MRTLVLAISLLLFVAAGFGSVHAQSGTVTATVRPNPLAVVVSVPGTVVVGQWFDTSANITNLGNQTISGTSATIQVPQEVTVRNPKKKIGNLAGGQTESVTWRAKANSPGSFVIQVEATGNLAGEQIFSSDSAIISAVNSLALFLLRLIPGV